MLKTIRNNLPTILSLTGSEETAQRKYLAQAQAYVDMVSKEWKPKIDEVLAKRDVDIEKGIEELFTLTDKQKKEIGRDPYRRLRLVHNRLLKGKNPSNLRRLVVDLYQDVALFIPDVISLITSIIFNQDVPRVPRAIAFASMVYLVVPFDLIPDMIPVIGLIDDTKVLFVACVTIISMLSAATQEEITNAWPGNYKDFAKGLHESLRMFEELRNMSHGNGMDAAESQQMQELLEIDTFPTQLITELPRD